MRISLIFAPVANPSYAPLGLASLAECLRNTTPDCSIRTVDLNIATWHRFAAQADGGHQMVEFMQGRSGNFHEPDQYLSHQQAWVAIEQRRSGLIDMARIYLQNDSLDGEFRRTLDFCCERALAGEPQMLGLSVMYPRQALVSLALAKYVRAAGCGAKIVLGGATAAVLSAREILTACPYVDAVFTGEGEAGLLMLCRDEPAEAIAGLSYRDGGGIVVNRKPDTLSMAKMPMPTFETLDLKEYANPEPVLPVVFSRGCKWRRCRFCAHNFSYSGYRRRGVAEFVDYLAAMQARWGARHFYLADQYVDAEDMLALSQEIIERRMRIAFQVMARPTADYTPGVLAAMSHAGCRWISWGVESGSQRLLDLCVKGTRTEEIRVVLRDAHAAGISNMPMMIFGLPTSTGADLQATLDLLDDAMEWCDDVAGGPFVLFDGTAFAARPGAYGLTVTGREELFAGPQGAVHSARLFHRELAQDGSWRAPAGPVELAAWQRRRQLARFQPRHQTLCCEHYLLYAARGQVDGFLPAPQRPPGQNVLDKSA